MFYKKYYKKFINGVVIMKKIYILLMDTKTIPSKLISFFTRYKYSHVCISLDQNCDIVYSFGRKKVNSIFNGGFVEESKYGEFFQKFNKTYCRIYEMKISDEQYKDIEELIEKKKMNSEIYKYDFLGIIPRFFGIPIKIKNKYVCSYFVASVLKNANVYNFTKDVCLIKPKDFEGVKGFKQIYEGMYKLYNYTNCRDLNYS